MYFLPVATHPEIRLVNHPAIAMRLLAGEQFRDGQVLISHFLSSLAWAEGQAIEVVQWTGGNLPRSMGGYSGGTMMTDRFRCRYAPDPADANARLALGFYREGMYLNHVAYQCLSYFKILNIFLRNGASQIAWINANLTRITDHEATGRLQQISGDVGVYLYGSNRCAVAHAGGSPTADPENPEDMARLQADLPLVRALADVAIEDHFGVQSSRTVWREHLYELEGFRQLFGAAKTATIKDIGALPAAEWPILPNLSIRLEGHDVYAPLENLEAHVVDISDGKIIVDCRASTGFAVVRLGLDLREERLRFDGEQGIATHDDGTAAAAHACSRIWTFRLDYLLNGVLEVWHGSETRLLGRCDAFMPLNIDMNGTVANFRQRIDAVNVEAARRATVEGP